MSFDLNKADKQQITKAFQVSDKKADEIVKFREQNGGFQSWDDVKKIPGFSDEMSKNLRQAGAEIDGEGPME